MNQPDQPFTMRGAAIVMLAHENGGLEGQVEARATAKTASWPHAILTITPQRIDLKVRGKTYKFQKKSILEVRLGVVFEGKHTLLVRHKGFFIETAHFWPTLTGRIRRTLRWRMAAIAWALEDCGYIEV